MSAKRIGEFLSRLVPLSLHDVEEILSEQRTTNSRFGEVALALGLCRPEHVWRAWIEQLAQSPQHIDLNVFGIDIQAATHIPADVARELRVIPVRAFGDEIVVAVEPAAVQGAASALAAIVNKRTTFASADAAQIARAIDICYPRHQRCQPPIRRALPVLVSA